MLNLSLNTLNTQCLFDFCQEQEQIKACLRSPNICDTSRDRLARSGLDAASFADLDEVLHFCGKLRVGAGFRHAMTDPLRSLAAGGIIGVGASAVSALPAEKALVVCGASAMVLALSAVIPAGMHAVRRRRTG